MTEQELRTSITPCIMAGNTWFVFEQIKAYADAETKELEEAYAELKSIYDKFYESDAVQHKQILALNAEIKRLREGIHTQWDFIGKMPASSVSEDFNRVYNALGVLCFDYNLDDSPLNEDQE